MFDYGPLIKWGLIVLAVLGFSGSLIYYGEQRKQEEWDAAITKQATLTASELIERARRDASGVVQYIEVTGKAQVRTQIVEKEVVRYVESPSEKCQLSPEFEWAFDTVSRLPSAGQDSVPTAPDAAGAPVASASAPVTDAEVLRAYEAAIVQYRDLWLAYTALVAWVRASGMDVVATAPTP